MFTSKKLFNFSMRLSDAIKASKVIAMKNHFNGNKQTVSAFVNPPA